jgi:hypothetical protein
MTNEQVKTAVRQINAVDQLIEEFPTMTLSQARNAIAAIISEGTRNRPDGQLLHQQGVEVYQSPTVQQHLLPWE